MKLRSTRLYVLGYSLHNYELFGQRSWMLGLARRRRAQHERAHGALLHEIVDELALRCGRERMIFFFMGASGTLACVLGFTAPLPWIFVVLLMCVHYGCMLGDSGALTSGVIAATPPEQRGATMAVYSLSGFTAAWRSPASVSSARWHR